MIPQRIHTALAGLGILLVSFIPQFILGKAYSHGDWLVGYFSGFTFFKEQILSGGSFLWAGSIGSGFPIYLDPSFGFSSLSSYVLFRYLPVIDAYHAAIFLGTSMLFLFSYLCAREFATSRAGSLLAALVFTFGYHNSPWSNNISVVAALFTLPLMLLSLAKISRGSFFWILIGGVGTGYALMMSQPQWVLMAFVGGGLYALYHLGIRYIRHTTDGAWLRALLGLLAILCVSAAISWPQISAIHQFASLSTRAGGLSFSSAQISSITPVDLIWFILPELGIKYVNASEPSLYVGVLPLVFALIGIAHSVRSRSAPGYFLIGLFIFGLLSAVKFSPIFWLLHQLPIFSYFRGSNRWMYIGNFGLSMLAGIGFDHALAGRVTIGAWKRIQKYIAWIFGVIVVFAGFVQGVWAMYSQRIMSVLQSYFDRVYYPRTVGQLPLEHYHNALSSLIDSTLYQIDFRNPKFGLPLLFLAISYTFFSKLKKDGTHTQRSIIIFGLCISFLNIISLHPNYYQVISRSILEATPATAHFLSSLEDVRGDRARIYSYLVGDAIDQKLRTPFHGAFNESDYIEFRRDLLQVNMNMAWHISSIDGASNLMPARSLQILDVLGGDSTAAGGGFIAGARPLSMAEKVNFISSRIPLLSMMNTKYVLSAFVLPESVDLRLIRIISSTRFNIPIYLYENKKVLPRLYFANAITYLREHDERESFEVITDSDNDFSKTTFIECQECSDQANVPSRTDFLTMVDHADGYMRIQAKTARGRWLIFSELNVPGWDIKINGEPAYSRMANYLYHGIFISPGIHDIVFKYTGI